MELAIDLAQQLNPLIRFGGSTWTYPGWRGIIYHKEYKSEKDFNQHSLAEYAQTKLFRTVGIDSFFYRPPTKALLKSYCEQVPTNFKWVAKVWEEITIPTYPAHKRYGKNAGLPNPNFLNAELFIDRVLSPFKDPEVADHTGPFVFQFPTISPKAMPQENFLTRLADFLKQLPTEFQYATELRNREFLSKDYFEVLNQHGVTHCFNHWHYMPPLKDQMKAAAQAGGLTSNFFVARILTPPDVSYEAAVELFKPYDQIKRPNPKMRTDVIRLMNRAIERNVEAYIIVNNRAEGNSPYTISEILREYFQL